MAVPDLDAVQELGDVRAGFVALPVDLQRGGRCRPEGCVGPDAGRPFAGGDGDEFFKVD